MKHIRYITSNKPVCEKPDALGSDFIVQDYTPRDEAFCNPCYQLVVAHNKHQYERDGLVNYPQGHSVSSDSFPSDWAQGFVVATVFWICVVGVFLALNRWG